MNRQVIERELQKIKAEVAEISICIDKPEWNRAEAIGVI